MILFTELISGQQKKFMLRPDNKFESVFGLGFKKHIFQYGPRVGLGPHLSFIIYPADKKTQFLIIQFYCFEAFHYRE